MVIRIEENEVRLTAFFEGRLDTAAAVEADKTVKPLYDYSGQEIVLDCSGLDYISSSGLRIFLGILKSAKAKGVSVSIAGASVELRKLFAMTGFNHLFNIL